MRLRSGSAALAADSRDGVRRSPRVAGAGIHKKLRQETLDSWNRKRSPVTRSAGKVPRGDAPEVEAADTSPGSAFAPLDITCDDGFSPFLPIDLTADPQGRRRVLPPPRAGFTKRVTAEDPGSVVVPAPGVHTHTVVLLHPMYMAPEHAALCQDLPSFVRALGLPCVKFVFPTAPRRSISWPQGREDNIAAWYNYYTRRDGQDEHDIIDEVRLLAFPPNFIQIGAPPPPRPRARPPAVLGAPRGPRRPRGRPAGPPRPGAPPATARAPASDADSLLPIPRAQGQLGSQTRRLHAILDREAALLGGDSSKVVLAGASQGGTVALHAMLSYPRALGALICLRTTLVDTVSLPKNKRYSNSTTPVFVFTGDEDNVYTPQLQERSYSRLSEAGYPVEYHTEPNCNHWEYSRNEIRCAAAWIGRVCLQRGLRVSTAVSYQRSSSPEMQ